MIVKLIIDSVKDAPKEIRESGYFLSDDTKINRELNKTYEVYGISVYMGIAFIYIWDDGFLDWLPSSFFSVVDTTIPSDWKCNIFEGDVSMVIGPEEFSGSLEQYEQMLD